MQIIDQYTGCNSPLGIGRASAYLFARNGARAIFMCDYDDRYLEQYRQELQSLTLGTEIHPRRFDAANEQAVKGVVEEALEKYGRLDVMFANAGVANGKIFSDIGQEEFMKMMKINVLRSPRLSEDHARSHD